MSLGDNNPSKTEQSDFRGVGRAAQAAKRRLAVSIVLGEGCTQAKAAEVVGVSRQTVNRWIRRQKWYGPAGLLDGRRFSAGSNGLLKLVEAERVQRWIRFKTPDLMKLPYSLWTVEAVSAAIERRLKKTLSLPTVASYLKRAGFRSARPSTRAKQVDSLAAAWLSNEYPMIAERAKAARAIIYWAVEFGDAEVHKPRTQKALKRHLQRQPPQRSRKLCGRMIAAVSNRCLMRFMFHGGALTGVVLVDFMQRLVTDVGQKVFLIVDDQPIHRSKIIHKWVVQHLDQIEIFYRPTKA